MYVWGKALKEARRILALLKANRHDIFTWVRSMSPCPPTNNERGETHGWRNGKGGWMKRCSLKASYLEYQTSAEVPQVPPLVHVVLWQNQVFVSNTSFGATSHAPTQYSSLLFCLSFS